MRHFIRGTAGALAALALLGALTACTTSPDAAAPSATDADTVASGAPSASAEVTPSATPTPTPTLDASRPGTWLITSAGIGPLKIGGDRTSEQGLVTTYSGKPSSTSGGTVCPALFLHSTSGPALVAVANGAGAITDLYVGGDILGASNHATSYGAASPATASGIRLGSTIAALKAAYPALQGTGSYGADWVYYGVSDAAGEWITFTIHAGVVDQIGVSRAKTPPSEFCG